MASSLATKSNSVRTVFLDVTGTLLTYRSNLFDYYAPAAKVEGQPMPEYTKLMMGFDKAYKEVSREFPCFGHTKRVSNAEWWRMVVYKTFEMAGYHYDQRTHEAIFKRIYNCFGTPAPYQLYPDTMPFIQYLRQRGMHIGLVSNSSYRYRDTILPAMGLAKGIAWDFGVFSGIEGIERPSLALFTKAFIYAGNPDPQQILHIGDTLRKDYIPAKALGLHALLLDRTNSLNGEEHKGVTRIKDLWEAIEWLENNCPVQKE
eukprot:TRINITY_DN3892_c0_g1_i6.p1 TRINITY_DN3892_c0_g1~~TRINITY_DN3892_c0_g1_i6.p1  ORF type:complete len:259 (+),score=12.95 TRINITY_DN3892_c0_g1_i6:127-903(+)